MTDGDRSYWEKHAKNYDRSMSLLGRPIPRMVELAGEATRGLGRVLEVAAGTGIVTPSLAAGAGEVIATDYSAAMVAALEQRVRDAGASRPTSTPSGSTPGRSTRSSRRTFSTSCRICRGPWLRFDAW